MQNTLIYGRLSKGDAALESHEKRNVDYCAFKQYTVLERFEDEDTSGGIPLMERHGGRALMNRLQQGGIQHLVVAKLDRLGRKARDILKTVETLKELGVILHIVDFGGDTITTQGHMGKLILTIFAAIAEWELSEITDRTQKRADYKFERGELTGNVPYGYDGVYHFADGHEESTNHAFSGFELQSLEHDHGKCLRKMLVDNPEEQTWIITMAAWRGSGTGLMDKGMNGLMAIQQSTNPPIQPSTHPMLSYKSIADELNRRGVPTKLPAGRLLKIKGHDVISSGQWSCGNVASLLSSRHTARVLSEASSQNSAAA